MNFTRAHDQYLTPPDEPEAVLCEDCGEEMTDDKSGTLVCYYNFCPAKFTGTAQEMAIELYRLKDDKNILAARVKRLELHHDKHHEPTA